MQNGSGVVKGHHDIMAALSETEVESPLKRRRTDGEANKVWRWRAIYEVNGPGFSCRFCSLAHYLAPDFLGSFKTANRVEFAIIVDKRSSTAEIIQRLAESDEVKHDAAITCQIIQPALGFYAIEYSYIGPPDNIKPLFDRLAEQLYSDAYITPPQGGLPETPLDIFTRLWSQAHDCAKTAVSVPPVIGANRKLTKPNYPCYKVLEGGTFGLSYSDSDKLPDIVLEYCGLDNVKFKVMIRQPIQEQYANFIQALLALEAEDMRALISQETGTWIFSCTLTTTQLAEQVYPLLANKVYAGHVDCFPKGQEPRPVMDIFKELVDAAREEFIAYPQRMRPKY